MADKWFRWREIDGKGGYAVRSIAGLVVLVIYVVALIGASLVPILIGGASILSFVLALCLISACVIGFRTLVHIHDGR